MAEYIIDFHVFAGTDGIIKKIRDTVGDKPVYLSIDVRPYSFRHVDMLHIHEPYPCHLD